MKKIVLTLFTLLSLALAAYGMQHNPGHVLISLGQLRLETNLWLAVFGIVMLVLCLQILLRSVGLISRGLKKLKGLVTPGMSPESAKKEFVRGMHALLLGRWASAESALSKCAQYSAARLIAYMGAAYAAMQQNLDSEHYFLSARKACPKDADTILIVQAWITKHIKDNPSAAAILSLVSNASDIPTALLLQLELLEDGGQWADGLALMSSLRRVRAMPPQKLAAIERQFVCMILSDDETQLAEGQKAWDQLSSAQHSQPDVLAAYALFLANHDNASKALTLLRKALKRSWQPSLVTAFGCIQGEHASKQLEDVLAWAEQRAAEPALTLCLARTYAMNQMWKPAAEQYVLAVEHDADNPAIWLELADVQRALGQDSHAAEADEQAKVLMR